jgi:uncharacterized HhH-GPD family protein
VRRGSLFITGDPGADELLNTDAFALAVGMLLDQQIPLAWAFRGPATLRDRLRDHGRPGLDAPGVAALDPEVLVTLASARPAVHRYPAAMARRIHALADALTGAHDGDITRLWADGADAATVLARLVALPGFGEEKAKIFLALLAKRFGVHPPGWEAAAAPFSDDAPRSIADCCDPASLDAVRRWKQDQKAAGRDKQDRPLPGRRR